MQRKPVLVQYTISPERSLLENYPDPDLPHKGLVYCDIMPRHSARRAAVAAPYADKRMATCRAAAAGRKVCGEAKALSLSRWAGLCPW